MPRQLRQLRGDLRRAGWEVDRQSGSHQIWKHPLVAGADGHDAHPYQERDVRNAVRLAHEAQRRQQP
jgi:HicA toxin of bacterial toxin-antitoxin,